MRACGQNRKQISWLVAGCLEPAEERRLRMHLEHCEACRRHFEKLSSTMEVLVGARRPGEPPAREVFHQRFVATLRRQPANSLSGPTFGALAQSFSGWRVVLPVTACLLLIVALVWMLTLQPPRTQMAQSRPTPLGAAASHPELAPTLANYQAVAEKSLDSLDLLITRQGQKNIPAMASYTAAGLGKSSQLSPHLDNDLIR